MAWGWRGRTIGALATRHDRCLWLRVAEYRLKDRGGDIWNGTRTAAAHIPSEVPRPHLLGIHAWEDGDRAYQAELTTYVDSPPCSAAPVLRHSLDLDTDWWRRLRGALTALPRVTTERRVISQDYLDRALPTFLNAPGIDTTPPVGWQAAHGDLHWANLTRDGPVLLDWEGWGLAPAGYDVALLAVHSMLIPSVEARVRAEFAHILSTPAGRFAELIVIAELLQAAQRGDNPDLAERLPARVRSLLDG